MAYVEVFSDAGSAVALVEERVLVQVRWGELTVRTVEAIGAEARKAMARDARTGALLVQEATAVVPDGDAREVQRRVIGELVKGNPGLRIAAVVLGNDIGARLRRSMGRMLAIGDKRFGHFEAVADATAWLSREIGGAPTAAQLQEAVTALSARR